MKRLQRWTLGICSGVSETLGELENHEAVTQAALSDMRRSLARAQARAGSLRRHHEQLMNQSSRSLDEAQRWRTRAQLEVQEGPAVECLRRSRAADQKSQLLRKRAEEGRAQLEEVEAQVRKEEARFVELQSKHRLFQARQAAAHASSACAQSLGKSSRVDEVFERWELKISEQQYRPEDHLESDFDAFSDNYERKEEEAALLAEWRELRESEGSDSESVVGREGEAVGHE